MQVEKLNRVFANKDNNWSSWKRSSVDVDHSAVTLLFIIHSSFEAKDFQKSEPKHERRKGGSFSFKGTCCLGSVELVFEKRKMWEENPRELLQDKPPQSGKDWKPNSRTGPR